MRGITVFIGPSMVGKTTIAKDISRALGEDKISTDVLCHNHTYYKEDSIDLFDDLKDYMKWRKVTIVDIGSNTIESCTEEELKYLVDTLTINGVPPKFYLVLPHENKNISYGFLKGMAGLLKCGKHPAVLASLAQSLTTNNYKLLNPEIIYTLKGYKKPLFNRTKHYQNHLHKLSRDIIEDLKKDKPLGYAK